MERKDASRRDSVEQVDSSFEDQQATVMNSEEGIAREERAVANLENEISDKQNESECIEETQALFANKTANNIWEIVRDNTKSAIKCEVKGSIVSKAIDTRLQEYSTKREEQEVEFQELLTQDKIINEHLRSELINQVPLLTELEKTNVIVNFLDEQVTRNEERYQQMERGKRELTERIESMMNSFHEYEIEKQKEMEGIIRKIEEATAVKNKLSLDFENDMVRLKQELAAAETSLQEAEQKDMEIRQKLEETENECQRKFNILTEMQKRRERINKELNDLDVEELEQKKIMEEEEQKRQINIVQQKLQNIQNEIADKSRSLIANRTKLAENRSLNLVNLERLDKIKQNLEMYKAKQEEEKQKLEKMKNNCDSKLQETFEKITELQFKLSALESEVTVANEEKMDLSSKLTELKKEKDETSANEDKLKLQKRLLEHELEQTCSFIIKFEEQSTHFTALDSLNAAYDETMKKYTCEVDEDMKNLREKKQHLITELEETNERFNSALKHRQKEFDILLEVTTKETSELQEKTEKDLQEAQHQATAAANALSDSKEDYRKLLRQYNATIRKRDYLGKKLNILGNSKSQNTSKNQENSSPPRGGILKFTRKRPAEKKVRFNPPEPNWETVSDNSSENICDILSNNPASPSEGQQGGINSIFDDLRNSPPTRENPISKNQSTPD